MSISTVDSVPEKLTDEEARKILSDNAGRARAVTESITKNNTRAEQGAETLKALAAKAQAAFGTSDVAEMRAKLDSNLVANAEAVKGYLQGLAQREQAIEALSKSAPR